MNRRRELVLQRVSRIGGLTAVDNYQQNAKHKGSAAHARTIEAALGTYLMKDDQVYDLRRQDTYTRSYGEAGSEAQEQLARQMKEYVTAAEESQLANAKSDLERRYHKIEDETDFDWLDANRCSGFLLYSYNKKGIHSVLGEQYSSAGFGGTFATGY